MAIVFFGVFVNGFQNSHMLKYYARPFASLCLAMSKSLLHNQRYSSLSIFIMYFLKANHVFVVVVIRVV
jgi:hypothetical protein